MITGVSLVQVFFALAGVAIEVPQLYSTKTTNCTAYYYITLFGNGAVFFCSYFILWFRSFKLFYHNKKLKLITKTWVRYVHFSALPLLIMVTTSLAVLQWTPPVYIAENCICPIFYSSKSDATFFARLVFTYYIISIFFFNIVFLFSFVYPLCLHKRAMSRGGINQDNCIMAIMKRAAIVGVSLVFSDLAIFGIVVFVAIPPGSRGYPILLSFNSLIKVLAIIMSFSDWREKLFPFKLK